jgi:uncharacterized membrane protein YfcA
MLLAYRLGDRKERKWHVRLGWVVAAGMIAFAVVGIAAHALIGFKDLVLPHGWLGALIAAMLVRQVWLGRHLQKGDERERARHRWNARTLLILAVVQVLSGMFYASAVM